MPQTITVLTPEKVEISLRLGGLASRAGALALDILLWFGIMLLILVGWIWLAVRFELPENVLDVGLVVLLWCTVVGFFTYVVLCTWLARGRTIGKLALGLRVVTTIGGPVPIHSAVLRTLLLVADVIPFLLIADALLLLLNPKCQRLGDMLAGTLVVFVRRPRMALTQPPARAHNPLLSCVTSVSALDEDDLDAIEALLQRYAQLEEGVGRALTDKIWQAVEPRIQAEFPPEATVLQRLQAIAAALEQDLERR